MIITEEKAKEAAEIMLGVPLNVAWQEHRVLRQRLYNEIKPASIKEWSMDEMHKFLLSKGIFLADSMPDTKYYIPDWEFMKKLFPFDDWSEKVDPWVLDKNDCDKRVFRFLDFLSQGWGINSSLKTRGGVTFGDSVNSPHAWAFVLATDANGDVQVYHFDPTYNSYLDTPLTDLSQLTIVNKTFYLHSRSALFI